MRRETRIHPNVLQALSGATVARMLDQGYLSQWPFAWTRKGWRWFTSAMRGEAA